MFGNIIHIVFGLLSYEINFNSRYFLFYAAKMQEKRAESRETRIKTKD